MSCRPRRRDPGAEMTDAATDAPNLLISGGVLDIDVDDVDGLDVARGAASKMPPGGTLVLMGGTGGRKISKDLGLMSAATAMLPPFTATLALELAPVRVNLIAAGFVDTPLSASLLGDQLEDR